MKKIFLILSFSGCILFSHSNVVLAFDGYYTFSNQNIEFRLAKKIDDFSSNEENWPIKKDIEGNKFFISEEVCINNADLEGILVEKLTEEEKSATFNYNGKVEKALNFYENCPYRLIIYFKKDSWKKIRELTERSRFYNMALIRDGAILVCPAILDKFDKEAYISKIDLKTMKLLLNNLKKADKPSSEQRNIEYKDWLIKNINTDSSYAMDLDSIGYKNYNAGNYKDAISIFELILNNYPSWAQVQDYYILGDCYYRQGNHDKAISVYEKVFQLNQISNSR